MGVGIALWCAAAWAPLMRSSVTKIYVIIIIVIIIYILSTRLSYFSLTLCL